MTDDSQWLRKDLRSFEPYRVEDKKYIAKLDANESPFSLPDEVKKDIIEWLENGEDLNRYPDTNNAELCEALSVFWQVKPENVTCGVGSDQLIDCITKAFLEVGEAVLTLAPTFSMYGQSAVINKGCVLCLSLDAEDKGIDIDLVIKMANEKAKILFLCTPNNPTGTSLHLNEIHKILQQVNILVVVDEAYGEFTSSTCIPFIDTYKNLIVLRTFSKAYGLAGARVGYAIASEEMIKAIDIVRPPYNLPTMSQKLAVAVIRHSELYKERIQMLIDERDKLIVALRAIPALHVLPSEANFVYVESKEDIGAAWATEGILVRRFVVEDGFCFRISIGTPEQNRKCLAVLEGMQ